MCELDPVDFDCTTVWREQRRRAKREYTCVACGSTILVGDKYLYHFDVTDGNASVERCCIVCAESREVFRLEHVWVRTPWNHDEELRECIAEAETKAEAKGWRDLLAALLRRRRASRKGRAA